MRHGTQYAWQTHQALGEPLCALCAAARSEYAAWYRFRTAFNGRTDLKRCRGCGSVFKGHTCHAWGVNA